MFGSIFYASDVKYQIYLRSIYVRGYQKCNFELQTALNFMNLKWQEVDSYSKRIRQKVSFFIKEKFKKKNFFTYLIISLMKSPKNLKNIAIFEIQGVS